MDEQALLYAATVVVLLGTLIVFGVSWWRGRGRGGGDGDGGAD